MIGKIKILMIFLVAVLLSCTTQYSPWESDPDSYDCPKNLTEKNLEKILTSWGNKSVKDSLKIAFISDSHLWYDQLEDAVQEINKHQDIDFLIHGGDMTESGLIQEYKWFTDEMDKLKIPWLTVMGNHDCLNNGISIYEDVFGAQNYNLQLDISETQKYNFVFLNDNMLEINMLEEEREEISGWIKNTYNVLSPNFDSNIFVTHVPPNSSTYFSEEMENGFRDLIEEVGIDLFVYGHNHSFQAPEELYNNGVLYMGLNCLESSYFTKITFYAKSIGAQEQIQFKYENIEF